MKLRSFLTLVCLFAFIATSSAQSAKVGRTYYEDEQNGYRFRYLHEWEPVPPQPNQIEAGILLKVQGPARYTETELGQKVRFQMDLMVIGLGDDAIRDESEESDEPDADRSVAERLVRRKAADSLGRFFQLDGFDAEVPDVEKVVKVKKMTAVYQQWDCVANSVEVFIDVWTFAFPERERDLALIYLAPRDQKKKWGKAFDKSAKTFEPMEITAGLDLEDVKSYPELLAYHEAEASRTPGWRAVETPSKKFIIKTSSDDERFIQKVITRLEKSRAIFEQDFPPEKELTHVSIVRVCQNESEFHEYGGTGGGVAGWFNPGTTELVLYDASHTNGAMTFAVMTHEGFHQYCFFLFDRSEAHRWFDEGHGDFYGGYNLDGRKPKVEARMPGGLDRLSEIRKMIRQESYAPIAEHINYSHNEWQNQGPSNVSCYSQSWSIIYMLRQGTAKKVPNKVWKAEYANIIPNYVRTLNEGFRKAYDELRKDLEAEAKARGYALTEDELQFNSHMLDPSVKQGIWKDAIEASWGQVDLDEFQENWVLYVDKFLK